MSFPRGLGILGRAAADSMEYRDPRTTYALSADQLQSAWRQVQDSFRECSTCHQIVCIPDFDEVSGFCDEDSPRAAEVEAAKADSRWDAAYDSPANIQVPPEFLKALARNARAKARRRIAAWRHRSSGCNHAPRPGRLPAESTVTAD